MNPRLLTTALNKRLMKSGNFITFCAVSIAEAFKTTDKCSSITFSPTVTISSIILLNGFSTSTRILSTASHMSRGLFAPCASGAVPVLVARFFRRSYQKNKRKDALGSSSPSVGRKVCSWASVPTPPVCQLFDGFRRNRWKRHLRFSTTGTALALEIRLSWFKIYG